MAQDNFFHLCSQDASFFIFGKDMTLEYYASAYGEETPK
jgi:hypothetical protein